MTVRTHLVTGPGGAGVTTACAALAAHAAAAGTTVTLAVLHHDGSLPTVPPTVHVEDLSTPAPWGLWADALALTVERYGGDADTVEQWPMLPTARRCHALARLAAICRTSGLTIVDLGDLRAAQDFLGAAIQLSWSLSRLLGVQPALTRGTGGAIPRLLRETVDAVETAVDVLRAPTTALHVVSRPDERSIRRIRYGVPGLLLTEVHPGTLWWNTAGVAPPGPMEPSDRPDGHGWSPFIEETAPLDPPAGIEQIAAVATAILDRPARHDGESPLVDLSRGQVSWRLPLPWTQADNVHLVHRGEDLLVTVHGVEHLVVPPAVLRRGIPVQAALDGAALTVQADLPAQAWRGRDDEAMA
ncbi:hypothetical protein KEM60_02316 [Austwickia sp. TVS 96-490-7B]|uniref:hypothetical protein n=1 Tax=Austwickia sp. TVS 96-490-7B TaxID=2830843 RepID=UPI001C589A4C|nr:hypothetical protein [Austwickia sp. TVS 96-490-7B]MBW3086105.1 hypothetical protein [Austwickia sp. TVS 96-490-7B]